eukprot:365326-Chlamydomonas_euryale.AAC.13
MSKDMPCPLALQGGTPCGPYGAVHRGRSHVCAAGSALMIWSFKASPASDARRSANRNESKSIAAAWPPLHGVPRTAQVMQHDRGHKDVL